MFNTRLGQFKYLNCLPVYHALEEGLLPHKINLIKGPPTYLNQLFLDNKIDVTPISSIEHAKNNERCIILPNLSICADGRVASVLLFSKVPVTELEGKIVYLTSSSATSVVLLKILFEHYFHVEASLKIAAPNLEFMLEKGDAALLIGDDAIIAHQVIKDKNMDIIVTDLGEAWKNFTGEKMIYAVWIIQNAFAEENPEAVNKILDILHKSLNIGKSITPILIKKAHELTNLPENVLKDYFNIIQYDLGESEKRALLTFYDYAYKSGLIEERIRLTIWGETI